jgi:hypothetical protein
VSDARVTPARSTRRADTLRRLWPRRFWDACGRPRRHSAWERYLSIVAAVSWAGAAFLDVSFLGLPSLPAPPKLELPPPPPGFPALDPEALQAQLEILLAPVRVAWQLGCFALNTWVLDRILTHLTPTGWRPRPTLLFARRVVAGVPVLGLVLVPLWRRLVARDRRWATAQSRAVVVGRAHPARRLRALGVGADAWLFGAAPGLLAGTLWLLPCQIAPLLDLVDALAAGPWPALALAATIALHVIAAVTSVVSMRLRLAREGVPAGRAAHASRSGWSALLPFPLSLLAGLLWWRSEREHGERGSLAGAAARRTARRAVFAALHARPRGAFERPRPSVVERHRRSFYRLKTAALLLDAAALAWLLTRVSGAAWGPVASRSRSAVLAWLLLPPLPGIALATWRVARRVWTLLQPSASRSHAAREPLGRYLFYAPLACIAGFLVGPLVGQPDSGFLRMVVGLIGLAAIVWLMYAVMFEGLISLVPRGPKFGLALPLWLGAFTGATLLLVRLLREPDGPTMFAHAFLWAAGAAPVASVILVVTFRRALLAPFDVRDVLDRRLPVRVRVGLAFVALSAALPLGGLAAPAWMLLRERAWPRFTRAWLASRQSPPTPRRAVSAATSLVAPSPATGELG